MEHQHGRDAETMSEGKEQNPQIGLWTLSDRLQ